MNCYTTIIMMIIITGVIFWKKHLTFSHHSFSLPLATCCPVLSCINNSFTVGSKELVVFSEAFTLDWKPVSPRSHPSNRALSLLVKSLTGSKILANAGNLLLTSLIFFFSLRYFAFGNRMPPFV